MVKTISTIDFIKEIDPELKPEQCETIAKNADTSLLDYILDGRAERYQSFFQWASKNHLDNLPSEKKTEFWKQYLSEQQGMPSIKTPYKRLGKIEEEVLGHSIAITDY